MTELTQHHRDLIAVAHATGMIAYCPSGRPTLSGYVCIHCGHDFEEDRKCLKPVNEQRTIGV